jgi:hypothetical protein
MPSRGSSLGSPYHASCTPVVRSVPEEGGYVHGPNCCRPRRLSSVAPLHRGGPRDDESSCTRVVETHLHVPRVRRCRERECSRCVDGDLVIRSRSEVDRDGRAGVAVVDLVDYRI